MRATILAFVLGAAMAAGVGVHADTPPLTDGWYVDKGACPFEGCSYREWTVHSATPLYERPRGGHQVGTANVGDTVRAETAHVYTRPIRVTVVAATRLEAYSYTDRKTYVRELQPGERFYLLTYEGEGFNIAWLDGKRLSVSIVPMHDRSVHRFKSCETPSQACWWSITEDRRERESEWWVRIRLPDGTVGWTDRIDNFRGVSLFE
jgi:hypothetical protein